MFKNITRSYVGVCLRRTMVGQPSSIIVKIVSIGKPFVAPARLYSVSLKRNAEDDDKQLTVFNKAERFQDFLTNNGSADAKDWWGYSDVNMFSAHHPDLAVPIPYLLDEILPGETAPLPRKHDCKFKFRCKCFQPFDDVCYMVCSKNNQAFAIGKDCLKKLLPPEQRTKRCLTCKELYRGKYANCKDCREKEEAENPYGRDWEYENRLKSAVERLQSGSFETPTQTLPLVRKVKPRWLKLTGSVSEICEKHPHFAENYFRVQMGYEIEDNRLRASDDRVYDDARNLREFGQIMRAKRRAESWKFL